MKKIAWGNKSGTLYMHLSTPPYDVNILRDPRISTVTINTFNWIFTKCINWLWNNLFISSTENTIFKRHINKYTIYFSQLFWFPSLNWYHRKSKTSSKKETSSFVKYFPLLCFFILFFNKMNQEVKRNVWFLQIYFWWNCQFSNIFSFKI